MPFSQQHHVLDCEDLRPHQCIETRHRFITLQKPTEVERRSHTRSHGNARDPGDLVIRQCFATYDEAVLPSDTWCNQLYRNV
jgi:hypothetical protein